MTKDAALDLHVEYNLEIARITLDRPASRNAYSEAMVENLCRALDEIEAREDVHVAILTGAGSCFSAGGDLKAMRDRSGMFAGNPVELRTRYSRGIQSISRRIADFEKPLIAMINGPAIGAGLDLACMCDLRIASENARFGSTFVKVGLIPGDGGAHFLTRVVGFPTALDLILSGRVINAAQALQIGLVHRLVPPEQLEAQTMEYAKEIAQNPVWAVRMAKRLCYRSACTDVDTALDLASAFQGLVQHDPAHENAVEAMLDAASARTNSNK